MPLIRRIHRGAFKASLCLISLCVAGSIHAASHTSTTKKNTPTAKPGHKVIIPAKTPTPVKPLAPSKPLSLEEEMSAAQTERDRLQQSLADLRRDITSSQSNRSKLQALLRTREMEFSQTENRINQIRQKMEAARNQIEALTRRSQQINQDRNNKQGQLGQTVTTAWQLIASNDSRLGGAIKISPLLPLIQSNMQDQSALIKSLENQEKILIAQKESTENTKAKLADEAQNAAQRRVELEKEKIDAERSLQQAIAALKIKEENAARAAEDDARLSGLITLLGKKIEQRNLLEARLKAEALRKREQEQQKNANNLKNVQPPPTKPAFANTTQPVTLGRFKLPTQGNITLNFGEKRKDGGLASRGLFIHTDVNAPVQSIANGRVAFAGILKGFGNLIIIDHGGQTLSVYANNHRLEKIEGAEVKTGDIIAYTGATGNYGETGLYFELRIDGRSVDPLRQ